MTLHNIGGLPSNIQIGIVYTGLLRYMFPQIINAHIHQLTGIQRAAPKLGASGRMCRFPCKIEADSLNGKLPQRQNAVLGVRMPSQRKINRIQQPRLNQEFFACPAFFSRAAEVTYCPSQLMCTHDLCNSNSRGRRTGTQGVMTASMTWCAFYYRGFLFARRFLAQFRKGIKFP